MSPSAVAVAVLAPPVERAARGPSDLAGLRRRLASTSREMVVVDFLEDDLREAQAALGEVAGWLDAVQDALHDARAGRDRFAALAARDPAEPADYLGSTLAGLRRRLAQISAALSRAEGGARPRGGAPLP